MARLRKEAYLVNEPTFLNPWETIDYGKRTVCRGGKGRFAPAVVCEMEEKSKTKKKKSTTKKQEPEILNPILEGGFMETLLNPMEELMIINPRRTKRCKKCKKDLRRRKTRKQEPDLFMNAWFGDHEGHRKAALKGWARRKGLTRQNPFELKGISELLKDSAMLYVGFAGSNYLFYMLGDKVPVLAKPPVKAIVKLGLAVLLEKKVRPIALGVAVSGIRDVIAMVSPQLAGQLSAMEQYLPEPELKEIDQYLPQPETTSQYLPEPEMKEVNTIAELQQEEDF